MRDLNESRKIINDIDKEIIKLFEKRMDIVLDIALYKKNNDLPIFHPEREKEVISRNINLIENKNLMPYANIFLITIKDMVYRIN